MCYFLLPHEADAKWRIKQFYVRGDRLRVVTLDNKLSPPPTAPFFYTPFHTHTTRQSIMADTQGVHYRYTNAEDKNELGTTLSDPRPSLALNPHWGWVPSKLNTGTRPLPQSNMLIRAEGAAVPSICLCSTLYSQ